MRFVDQRRGTRWVLALFVGLVLSVGVAQPTHAGASNTVVAPFPGTPDGGKYPCQCGW